MFLVEEISQRLRKACVVKHYEVVQLIIALVFGLMGCDYVLVVKYCYRNVQVQFTQGIWHKVFLQNLD